jgi:formate hydrogenlyase subunit 3/multisubunit Na+/H+ antiporter MnhD subunit
VSVLPFLAIAFGGAAASLLLRRWVLASAIVGLVALLVATVAAATIRPDDGLIIAGGGLTGSAFGRLFLLLVTGAATVLVAIALATGWTRNLPGALLAGLGGIALALSLPDPTMAALATLIGGLAGVLVTLPGTATPRGVAVAAREIRAIAVGGALVLLAMAWISRPLGALAQDTAVFGLAYLAVAVGMAMRFGAIPFHLWAARVAEAAPEVALPMLLAWGPAALAVVGLAWVDGSIAPVAPVTGQLPVERLIIVGIGVSCLVLGAIAAWVQEDLEHVVGYATVQDAGVVILAFAVLDPAVWAPSRTWILVMLAVRTAFAAWAVAVRARYRTRRISELRGWAFRSPLLVVALVAIGAASVGWPGLLAFDARATVINLALDGPVQGLVLVSVFLPLLYYGRLLAIGFTHATPEIAAIPDDRLRAPARVPAGGARPASGLVALGRLLAVNRGPLVASFVLLLAASAVTVAAGGFGFVGVTDAAVEAAPVVSGGTELPVTGPGPSRSPGARDATSPSPGQTSTPAPSPSRGPSPSGAPPSPSAAVPSPSGSPAPTKSPAPSRTPGPSPSASP